MSVLIIIGKNDIINLINNLRPDYLSGSDFSGRTSDEFDGLLKR